MWAQHLLVYATRLREQMDPNSEVTAEAMAHIILMPEGLHQFNRELKADRATMTGETVPGGKGGVGYEGARDARECGELTLL